MHLISYKTRDLKGQLVSIDLSELIGHPKVYVSCSPEDNGILIQVLCEDSERLFNLLPKWVHEEFRISCGHRQLMVRSS